MRRLAPHAIGILGTVLLVSWAGRIDRVAMLMMKRTFEPQTGLFLGALALLVLAGFLLAAPAPDRLLPGIQSASVTVTTVGCLLLGYGLGQGFGSKGED